MSVLTCISSSFHSVQMPFRNIWIDSTLSTLLDGWSWTAWGCYLKCCCHVLLVSRVVTVLLTLIGGPGFSSSRSVVPALLPPCSVLLRDTLRADCTGHGDLLLLAYFIENSHTAIQSTHVIQLWHNADADAWYKHYITATTYIWALHYISHFASRLVFRLLWIFHVCLLFVYTSAHIICAITMSRTLLQCDYFGQLHSCFEFWCS